MLLMRFMPYSSPLKISKATILFRALFIILTICYPFCIFFGLKYFGPRVLSCVLLLTAATNLFFKKSQNFPPFHQITIITSAAFLALLTQVINDAFFVKLYPVFTNISFLIMFGTTLIKPPSMAEIFARIRHPDLPATAIVYTKKVTVAWCIFFIINGLISLYTTLYCSNEIWTAYNGFISYCLIALMFGGEFLVRIAVIKKNEQTLN